jgi:hypothetical protein
MFFMLILLTPYSNVADDIRTYTALRIRERAASFRWAASREALRIDASPRPTSSRRFVRPYTRYHQVSLPSSWWPGTDITPQCGPSFGRRVFLLLTEFLLLAIGEFLLFQKGGGQLITNSSAHSRERYQM